MTVTAVKSYGNFRLGHFPVMMFDYIPGYSIENGYQWKLAANSDKRTKCVKQNSWMRFVHWNAKLPYVKLGIHSYPKLYMNFPAVLAIRGLYFSLQFTPIGSDYVEVIRDILSVTFNTLHFCLPLHFFAMYTYTESM